MPNATNNIFIDWSYLATQSGSRDVIQEYVAGNPDSIGEVNIVTEYFAEISGGYSARIDFGVDYTTVVTGSAFTSTAHAISFFDTVSGVLLTCLVDYSTPFTASGTRYYIDSEFSYFRKDTKTSGIQYVPLQWISGEEYPTFTSLPLAYYTKDDVSTLIDLDTLYTAANYYDESDPESHPVLSGTVPVRSYYTYNTTSSGFVGAVADITFAGYVLEFKPYDLSYKINVITGDYATSDAYRFYSETISGSLDAISFEGICGISGTQYGINLESMCGLEVEPYVYFITDVIDGRINYRHFNLICGFEQINTGFNFDVGLFSLKISDLSLGIGDFSYADGTVCVDITDDVYGVSTSGTYFIVDGVVASGIFTPIVDGYRMCYDPVDNFASLVGATELKIHALNNNNEVLERAFYLTSGYIVEYDNQQYPEDVFGFGDVVTVRLTAENFASCPTLGGSAYWFQVYPRYISDLGARIVCLPQEHVDLPATLIPDTHLVFFYGKVFRVELKAKDYAGNEMPPYIFEFRIEDKPV